MHTLAKVISNTLHPIIIPLLTYWAVLFFGFDNLEGRYLYLFIAFIICTVTPAAVVVVLLKQGKVNDYDISERKSRTIPLVVGIVVYVMGFFLLDALGAPRIASAFMICYAINTLVILFITFVWKISVHVTSLCGPVAALYVTFGTPMLLLLLLVPPLIWSRITLKAHTPMQTIAGATLGFFFTVIELRLMLGQPLF
jgi:membrane-associated phospholipid phosphatase